MIQCKITVEELRHCMTGKKGGRKTGLFCPLVGWSYLGQEIHEVIIKRYGIVEYHDKDNKLIGCFEGCAFLDD